MLSSQPVSGWALSSFTPPWVAQRVWPTPVVACEPFGPRDLLQVREVADRADVLEPVVFEERDPGRVVAAELEPLEAGDQQILGGAASDVTDDPAHAGLLL